MRIFFWIGLFGVLQYLVVTSVLMYFYPGGQFFDHQTIGYHFTENFLSDLGRTYNFGPHPNPTAVWYRMTLSVAGLATISFSAGMFFSFRMAQQLLSMSVLVTGLLAGIGYMGIANNPVNEAYFTHISFVQWGFLAFLAMSISCAALIQRSRVFNNSHSAVIWMFVAILIVQVAVMIFGPRSWSSYPALRLQVVLQKVVVYAEIFTTTYLCLLMLGKLPGGRGENQGSG
jgi:hypothetical membrane protein